MRLVMDGRARRLLRRVPVVNIYSAAELLLLAALAAQTARLVWTVVTPVNPLGDWRPVAPVVAGIPADALASFDPFFRLQGEAAPATVTSLQLVLFGTRIDEAQGGGSAIIAGPDGVQNSIAVGQEVAPGVRLKAVAFDHVTLDRGGALEDLFLDQSKAVQPVVPGGAPSAPGLAPPPASGPSGGVPVGQIRQEIGFIPRIDGGRVSGLVVRPQGSGALFREAGLREGDVVTAIGGRPVAGADDLDRIAADFRGGGNIPIQVERNNQMLSLALTVAPSR
ncbi:type II secretion system protein N [Sphingomonas sp.]|jgi:general secretion pathway protein C|uniref:type II secretion system protein N n=1 Tax=Sphingomonas sp. TaxID=28214 RepID=UPI002D7F4A7E|nr:type II secretion system protein N [Sphingomonas sp.]HEU0043777.1 type II secretion system protein N [Sphingomonas sp.]